MSDALRAKLARYGYREPPPATAEVMEAAMLGTAEVDRLLEQEREKQAPARRQPLDVEGLILARADAIEKAARIIAEDSKWLELLEHYVEEALSGR